MIRKRQEERVLTAQVSLELAAADSLNRIFKKVDSDGLSDETTDELTDDIAVITERFGISPKAAILLAAILEKAGSSSGCDEEDLARYIGCTNIEFIGFHAALDELDRADIICVTHNRRKIYCVSQEALKAIEKDEAFKPMPVTDLTTEELFTRFRIHVSNLKEGIIDSDRFVEEMDRLVEMNQQLLFCRNVKENVINSSLTDTEKRMFYYLCHRYVSYGNGSVPIEQLMNLTGYFDDDQKIKRHISLERTNFQVLGLVSFGCDNGFIDNETLSLSADLKNGWFQEIELAKEETVHHKDLIPWESIKDQELFYNEEEARMVEHLGRILEEENFNAVQERLESKGMPKGFNCVFHGCPGSGKTATLKALARRTKRDLFWVDLSDIRSKWVGESEKKVKALFDTYRKLVHTSERAPILAVNEADALFTRRITNVEQSSDQLSNALTDIVLNELETLDGILIATTNLVGNMMGAKDNAMERRFLYKIEFKAPEKDVRASIWKSKLGGLTDEQADRLATSFKLSGGSIDNVARKSTVDYVLDGAHPGIETLIRYCEDETVATKKPERVRVGF